MAGVVEKAGVSVHSLPIDHDHEVSFATNDWNPEEERNLKRKIDQRIFPMLCVILGLALLDRVNMGAAYIEGMANDLELDIDSRYSLILLIFFIGYFLFEIPSNLVIRRVGTRVWLSFLIMAGGLICMSMGLVDDYQALAGLRALLGVSEAGILPGAVFLIGAWYKPYEVATRVSLLWLFSQLIASFGPILAYGFAQISVGTGIFAAGWRWIFIIEGLTTILAGFVSPFLLIEFPEKAKFLTPHERHIALKRICPTDEGHPSERLTLPETLSILKDWKLILIAINYFIVTSSVYSLAYFTPIILRDSLQFTITKALLLTTPPSLIAALLAVAAAAISDRIRLRYPVIMFQALLGIIGLLMVLYARSSEVRYFGIIVASYGIQSNLQSHLTYLSNQIASPRMRGVATGFVVSFGALGGVCGSTILRHQDAPLYLQGILSTIGLLVLLIVILSGLTLYFRHMNRLADCGKIANIEGVDGFRYVL